MAGTIQPGILARVLTEEFRTSGFLARLLLALPPWRRRQWTEAEVDDATRAGFADLLRALHALPRGTWPDGRPAPHLVLLSDEAKDAFVAFYNANGDALGTADEDMSAAMSKLEGYALRFALIFHCCRLRDRARDARIAPDDMGAAIRLTGWFRGEAERVYAALGEPPEGRAARHQAEVVARLAERRGGRITPFELHRTNRRKYPTAEAAEAVLESLVGHGFGIWEAPPAAPAAGRPTRHYVPRDPVPEIPGMPNGEEPAPDPDPPAPGTCYPKSPSGAGATGNPTPGNPSVPHEHGADEGISGISGTGSWDPGTAPDPATDEFPVHGGISGSSTPNTSPDEFPFEEVL